jgi:hypothetical protein
MPSNSGRRTPSVMAIEQTRKHDRSIALKRYKRNQIFPKEKCLREKNVTFFPEGELHVGKKKSRREKPLRETGKTA